MIDDTKTTLLNLLSHTLFGAPLDIPDAVDWQEVYNESVLQSVSLLAFSDIQCEWLPEEVAAEWEENVNQVLINNVRVDMEHAQMHNILSSVNIPYVTLKGNVSASYYPDPMLRLMGDVDFLIDKKNIGKADLLLRKCGLELQPINHECERAYHKGLSIWELHWEVNGIPGGKIGESIHGYLSDMIGSAKEVSSINGTYMAPTAFHHGLVMLLHVARHMITGGIGLRHLCDWAVYVERIGDVFPDLFEEKLKDVGLWRFAQLLTQLSVRYLGSTPQKWMGEPEDELLDALKEDVFASGNFGKKDRNRADEAKFITSSKKGGVNNDSDLKQAILSANEIVRKHWRFAEKIPIVYPAGWAFFGGRYALRSMTGKRKRINIKNLADSAKSRKEIYKQMRLFEIENNNRKL